MPEYIYEVSDVGSTWTQVGELIRCRECTWYGIAELKKDGSVDERFKPSFCYLWRSEMDADDYCSYAERRE